MNDKPLFTVIVVALCCMMIVQIFGVYYEAIFPSDHKQTIYECDFEMDHSILTKPCTIRGNYYE